MTDRTEELGLAGRLPIQVGGERVDLRTLSFDESEKWQAKLAASAAGFDLPQATDPAAIFAAFVRQPSRVMLDLVMAYDVDKALGNVAALRKRITQRELYDAMKQMVTAELPLVTDLRSVAEAFGPQLRALAMQMLYQTAVQLQPASFMNGHSPTGDSTPPPSEVASPKSDS